MRQNAIPYKARRKSLNKLSIKDIREVFDAIKVDKLTHASTAIKFSVTASAVRQIVRNFRDKGDYVQELLDKQINSEAKTTMAVSTIQSFKDNDQCIWSINQVRDAIEAQSGVNASKRFVSSVLRNHFDMRFQKVKRVAFKGNSERSLVVRQQCAKKMLELLEQGFTIMNIDESWINELDFARRKWHDRNESNSLPRKYVSRRLSVLAAIDTEG